jgi:MscS family membrane protein
MFWIRILAFASLLVAAWGQEQAPSNAPSEVPTDSLGRSTPRGTVLGFLGAAHRGDYSAAARYLNTSLQGPAADGLARQLITILDRRLPAHLDQLSNQPEGSLNDNLLLGTDLVGSIQTSEGTLKILVERVRRPEGLIWLFSSATLEQVPEAYSELNSHSIDEYLPVWLAKRGWLSIPLWQWIALLGGLILAIGVSSLLRGVVLPVLRRLVGSLVSSQDNHMLDLLAAPIRALAVLAILHVTVVLLNLPLIAREAWREANLGLLIIACTWLFLRVVKIFARVAGRRLQDMGRGDSTSFVRLTQRTINFVVAFLAIVFVARSAGLNVAGAIAGLGVGGIAVALAAQKTLENLFGGVSIIFDKSIRVGDLCRIGDQEGKVQDIGIRSTRFRTQARTILTVPNGQLSSMNLENLGMRDKIRFRHIIGLRTETTSQQLNFVLEGLRALLAGHHYVEAQTSRVNFVKLGPSSMDLEVFAYVLTNVLERFLVIQEELLVGALAIVERSGTATALPSQVVYMNRDPTASRNSSSTMAEHSS